MRKVLFAVAIMIYATLNYVSAQEKLIPAKWDGYTPGNIYYTQGNVGIGTTLPTRKLELIGAETGVGLYTPLLKIGSQGIGNVGTGGAIEFGAQNYNNNIEAIGVIAARLTNAIANMQSGDLSFYVANDGLLKERMRLTQFGKLELLGEESGANAYTTLLKLGTKGVSTYGTGGAIELGAQNLSGNVEPIGIIAANLTDGGVGVQSGDIKFLVANQGTVSEKMRLTSNGNVGIGVTNPGTYKLAVGGTIVAEEVVVKLRVGGTFPDYVFNSNYKLRTLAEVEAFIDENGHLPEVPSAKEVEEKGLGIGDMNITLLKKVEELTLYAIQLEKRVNELENK